MPFRVTARTILQLGAELISSDAIAFYELIKNAFDAGSPRVTIDVNIRISHAQLCDLLEDAQEFLGALAQECDEARKSQALQALKAKTAACIDAAAPGAVSFSEQVLGAPTLADLSDVLAEANYITIEDTGEGMSMEDLDEVFLTIGTRSRLRQRDSRDAAGHASQPDRPILGEKGVGRLSTMRLGDRLHLYSARKTDPSWNELYIDWTVFSHSSDALIEDIDISPSPGQAKESGVSGTRLRISALSNAWTRSKLQDIAGEQFSKLTDPFTPSSRYPITVRYNGDILPIPRFERELLKHAHAKVQAEYKAGSDREFTLSGTIDYSLRQRLKHFRLEAPDLGSITSANAATLKALGPFSLTFYWYNRQILTAIDGIGDLSHVRELQARWAGGLMVFRDGFRVHPYGEPADDWLELDRRALASSGYKVNRRQIIGKVDITSQANHKLVDQTNREGLRDSAELRALIALLKHVLQSEFRPFLDSVDNEVRARLPASLMDIERRIALEEEHVSRNLEELLRLHPAAKQNADIVTSINASLQVIRKAISDANDLAASFERGRTQLVHLASLGMMVEFLAHELNRATSHTITTLASGSRSDLPSDTRTLFATLEAQLRTLQKRLRVLDPLSTSGRQVKEAFDLIQWTRDIVATHQGQFDRHGIACQVSIRPPAWTGEWRVRAVKGMVVQILENLLSNSVYWLKQQRLLQPQFSPLIEVEIRPETREIWVTDNGPGVLPERAEEVFQAFVTTKPPGEGRGIGLYVSREIARYNGASLKLSDIPTTHSDRLNTFVLAFDAMGME